MRTKGRSRRKGGGKGERGRRTRRRRKKALRVIKEIRMYLNMELLSRVNEEMQNRGGGRRRKGRVKKEFQH